MRVRGMWQVTHPELATGQDLGWEAYAGPGAVAASAERAVAFRPDGRVATVWHARHFASYEARLRMSG